MKRSLIFLLAAGPLFVFGQRIDLPPNFKSFQFSAPGAWRSRDAAFFKQGLMGSRGRLGLPADGLVRVPSGTTGFPVRLRSGFPVRVPFAGGFTVREMQPDGMPCLVPLRMPEQMPMSLRGNADSLPNSERRR